MAEIHEWLNRIGSVAAHSAFAVVGVIGANYLANYLTSPLSQGVGGIVVMAASTFVHGDHLGPVRLALGVAGFTLLARAVLGYAQITLPAEVSSVI